MNKRNFFNKAVTWLLITAMVNPAAMAPAFARDSDIFLSTTTSTTTAEPNIMIILDSSDSMNLPEPWREYAGAYDSHVEYLWNDTAFITSISNAAPTVMTTAGSWYGATLADRNALRTAAINYAANTETGDPGARNIWRNYNNAAWFYWLPAGTADTDLRLTSLTFNRWVGGVNVLGGIRGGINYGSTSSDYRNMNYCRDSGIDPNYTSLGFTPTGVSTTFDPVDPTLPQGLTPSTVFAPTAAPRNSGKYLNQRWMRWERFLNLREGRISTGDSPYPLSSGLTASYVGPALIGAGSGIPNVGSTIRGRAETISYPDQTNMDNNLRRDSWPAVLNFGSRTDIGDRGQPIRTRRDKQNVNIVEIAGADDSKSAWTSPLADMGGFNLADNTFNLFNSAAGFVRLSTILGWYGISAPTTYDARLLTLHYAWLGNRDNPPGGGTGYSLTTGTPAYYDLPNTRGDTTAGSPIVSLNSSRGSAGITVGTIVNVDGAGPATALPPYNLVATVTAVNAAGTSLTLSANAQATLSDTAITRNLMLTTGGTTAVNRCQVSYTLDADGTLAGIQGAFPATTNPDASNTSRFWVKSNAVCVAGAATPIGPGNDCTGVVPTNKAPSGSGDYITARYASCGWTGRQTLTVEGPGTYYYGGTCGASATCFGSGRAPNGASCVATGSPTTTFGTSSYITNNYCTTSGLTNVLVGTTPLAGSLLNNSGGCNNRGDATLACASRETAVTQPVNCTTGASCAACVYGKTSCPTDTWTTTAAPINTAFTAYVQAANDNTLVHDCTADNGTVGNPSSSYLNGRDDRLFGTAFNLSVSTATNNGAAYITSAGPVAQGPLMDTYSTNWMNWRFGAKGPTGAPIGRKTRLQIAKDALAGIVQVTDGVRFGLTVFNRTSGCISTSGSITAGTNQLTLPDNPGFVVSGSNNIRVVGAGTAGADLVTYVTAITQNANDVTLTLNANAGSPYSTTGSVDATDFASGPPWVLANKLNVSSASSFSVNQRISIAGAGPLGATLLTTITAIDTSASPFFTIDPPAETTVAGATVKPVFQSNVLAEPCSGAVTNDGANVARRILRMGSNSSDTPDYNNRASLIAAINAVTAAARTPLTESVFEAYRYFSGRAPRWGTLGSAAIIGGTVTQGRDPLAICTTAGAGTGCTAIGNYRSPMLNNPNTTTPAGCQKNYIVLITDGGPEDDVAANADIRNLSWSGPLGVIAPRTGLDANNANTTTDQFEASANTPYGPPDPFSLSFDGGYIWLDELMYFMANADMSPGARNLPSESGADALIAGRQSVNSYTIGFAGASSAVLQNAAVKGNGIYYTADNSSALSAAIISALNAITNWNPTVAAPTVPISALNRSENATDVYLAFFQPDPSSAWLGTVKKFQLSQYPNNGDATICGAGIGLCLTGQNRLTKVAPNIDNTKNIETVTQDVITGITQSGVDDNASSFWAPSTVHDGGRPNQGGTGHQLINNTPSSVPAGTLTPETRKVYTFLTSTVALHRGNSGSTIQLTDPLNKMHFSNTNITKCRLGDTADCASAGSGTMTDIQQESRINWLRGGDIGSTANCNDGLSTTCTVWRAWPHADVQHSKPAIVTYQITPSVVQYMYYLQNNGLLTQIDTATGIEKWSFAIEEALPQIQAMINDVNGAQLQIADGTPAVYVEDVNGDGNIVPGTDKVWLYFGLRRGGRVMYAIDITDPDQPTFGWKIDATTAPAQRCVASGACGDAPEFNELGQTWSTPFIGKVRANTNPVLIFGGGYDPAEDSIPPTTRTMGRAVFVVDAYAATVVQSWGYGQSGPSIGTGAGAMTYPIPSDVTSLNTDLDSQGYLDRLYVGDTWGNVFRFDVDSLSVGNWNAKLLATLSSDISSGERRKILFPPAIVKQNTPYRFDAVYIGTGDREHPLCISANQTTPLMTNTCALFAPYNKMFMLVDPDYGLTASNTAPIVVSDLYQRLTTDLTTNTSNTILNSYKGWYRDYDNGEKTANAPTVFNQRLRFGTYAPLGQSGGACVPPGEGRLNEIDAITGDLVPINGAVASPADRYYSSFITHGYISTGQLIVQGKNIYHIVVSDSRLQSVLVGSMGSATKIYWYMEPEQ